MQKKCYFYIIFNHQSKPYALVSLSKQKILDICSNEEKCLVKESFHKNECIYNSLVILQKEESFIKVDFVKLEHEIDFWIAIYGSSFLPKKECEKFLQENNLIKKWMSGHLKGVVYEDYYENSKNFGERTKVHKYEISFDTYEKIWSFSNLFYGIKNERHGDFSKFYYNQNINLLSVTDIKENKTYMI